MIPYQFAFHDNVSSTPPHCKIWEQVIKGNLTRKQKDDIFHDCQSNSGNTAYKSGGWAFPIQHYMRTFLVKYGYDSNQWREIKAFDKTCIRSSFYTNQDIIRITELPKD